MVEGVLSGIGGHCGSSSSSHSSSSSSSSSRDRDTKLLIRVSPTVQSERIQSFFDKSLHKADVQPIGPGFVRRVNRKKDGTVLLYIEDAKIANRLVSSFSDSRSKIDGHEFTIDHYRRDHSKSLSSPSTHNGDKTRDKEPSRMCLSERSPSSSKRHSSYSSPSTSRPSTNESTRKEFECDAPSPSLFSSSFSQSIANNSLNGIIGVSMCRLPSMCDNALKEILKAGLRGIGRYLTHSKDDSGGIKALLKRSHIVDEIEGKMSVQGEETIVMVLPIEETERIFNRYLSNQKTRDSVPSTSSYSSSSHPIISRRFSGRERDVMSYDSSRTIFLPCLPSPPIIVNKDWIRRRFIMCGMVLDSEVKNGQSVSPHAIVQFSHTQGAVLAMEEYEKEQMENEVKDPVRNRKRPHFLRSSASLRVWVANLPPQDEDYVKKKLLELLKGAHNPTIVVDLRRREGIIDFASLDKAKYYLEIFKSSPVIQQSGAVQTWLVADYCSDQLYEHFIERRGHSPSPIETEYINTLSKMHLTDRQKSQAEARMERMKGGEERTSEKKRSVNGENGDHSHSPSSTRRLNGEDRRSGDSGFSEDREKGSTLVLDSDDDEMLERKWRTVATTNERREENGKLRQRIIGLEEHMISFINQVPKRSKVVKKEVKEEEEGEKKENDKMTGQQRINNFRDSLIHVGSAPFKVRKDFDELIGYGGKDSLKSPPIPISPLNGDKERKHIIHSPPSGSRPVPLHINIPPSTSTNHSNATPSPYARLPPSSSTSSSRHPSISTPSNNLTPRSNTMPSRPNFPIESNGDHPWTNTGNNGGTPTSSRVPLSRRESVCSNSSQSYTPLPPSTPSTSGTVFPPSSALKSPPISSWNSTANAWKGGPSLPSPLPSSLNRSRPSLDGHHKPSTPSLSRPPGFPKSSMEKSAFPSSSLPKTPSLPRSTSMNEKKPNISRESSKDIVNSILQNKRLDLKQRIPKKENRERDEKEERREKKREEKDRERREDREERKERKEDRKKSRENETKEEKTRRRELKKKEKEKEERKRSMNDKKRKSIDGEKKRKKKKRQSTESESNDDSDFDAEKPSSSRQMQSDEAFARSLSMMSGSSMYDRVKGRRSGSNKEEKKKSDALEIIRQKKEKKTKKRVHLSSSSESDGERKESGNKWKKEEDEESSEEDEKEKERMKKEKKKEKKREKERRESSNESESGEDIERRGEEKKRIKVSKKPSTNDLFSDDADSVKSERKEKLSKKRSHEKDEKGDYPSSSSHPPPEKKVKKEETSSSQSESEDEGERSSKKSEVSTGSWRGREGKRLSESSIATHSEKDFGRSEEAWKSPASGSGEKEIKEEPKEEKRPRLLTKAAMKEFNVGASSSPLSASNWNREEKGLELSSEDSSSSSDSDGEKEETEVKKEEDEEEKNEEREEQREREETREEVIEEVENMEEENVEEKKEEETMQEKIEEDGMEEVKEEKVKMEVEESQSIEKDEEAERAVRGLEFPSDDAIEETEKAVESIFDEEEEPEAKYPSNDFLNQIHAQDMNVSSSSSQCSSPKIVPSTSHPLPSSSLPRPTPIHPSSISSPSILSPSLNPHLLHTIPPSISSPLISPLIISPSSSRPASIHFNIRPISQESSSQHAHDENGVVIQQEKAWATPGSSSDGPSPSPSHHPMLNKEQIMQMFPVKWTGRVGMKKNEVITHWLKLQGDEGLLNKIFPPSTTNDIIRVTGKFRLQEDSIQDLLTSMRQSNDTASLVVTTGGNSIEELKSNSSVFTEHLVTFFNNKNIAGVIEFTTVDGLAYRCHMFAPGQFVNEYLSPHYPDFLDLLNRKYPNAFLLALLKRKDE